ncbi:hypothetical protein DFQ28_010452 [Apophysomyces sp. BC1034]|nr:hypothetical protein DFQ30_001506 [Apophysomyces sp. BC1015]KAG0171088.1 hypothetical protein DFQ29_008991 [Apophysomyces sp. BC1021]KAG0184799.1 hypothetical protein DFQ28_010452 [Apophysomyces sp. BC1034]
MIAANGELMDSLDHLVFFIHGVGQQYEEYGNMEHHVSTLQKNTDEILASHFPDHRLRVKYVPVEWHSVVHKLVDAKMNQSTLNTVPKVRLATNDWVMDSLYYFTRPHGQCIIDTICDQCNHAYQTHLIEYPDFIDNQGQVHIVGCSLGGIAAYDIASMQWFEEDGQPPWEVVEESDYVCRKPDVCVPRLDFKLRYLFTCGSPIAATLIFRGLDYMHYRPPRRTQVFNIFHPFDPLGYRIEPMINEVYCAVHPVRLRRAQRRRILPRIPNLGIRSSIAGAAPLIMKVRQSFWQYVMTTNYTMLNTTDDSSKETRSTEEDDICSVSSDHQVNTKDYPRKRNRNMRDTKNTCPSTMLMPRKNSSESSHACPTEIHNTIENIDLPVRSNSDHRSILPDDAEAIVMPYSSYGYDQQYFLHTGNNNLDNISVDSHRTATMASSTTTCNGIFCLPFSESLSKDRQRSDKYTISTDDSDGENIANLPDMEQTNSSENMREGPILGRDGQQYPRTDYMLASNVIDSYASEWIVALKSHFRYWANRDLALHIAETMIDECVKTEL